MFRIFHAFFAVASLILGLGALATGSLGVAAMDLAGAAWLGWQQLHW